MKFARALAVTVALLGATRVASAQGCSVTCAQQNVPLQVNAIDKLAVAGSSVTITITSLTAPTTEFTTTYALTTNSATARKITGKIDLDLPAGVTMNVVLGTPGGAAVSTARNLTSTAQDLVTNITHSVASLKTITYTVTVAPTVAPQVLSRTVTFTLQ